MAITEIERHRFYATSTGSHSFIGPVLVDVVVTVTVKDDGTICTPSYYVHFNGKHKFGGFAWHLPADNQIGSGLIYHGKRK